MSEPSPDINSESELNHDTITELTAVGAVKEFLTERRMRKISESNMNILDISSFKPLEEEKLYTGKSLALTKFKYEDGEGHLRIVEGIQKKHHNGNTNSNLADTVSTIAILRRHILCDCLVLVKQYRPAIRSYTLEFPTKVIEHPEDMNAADTAALKEVEDDTGYTSSAVKHISPDIASDPDLSDSKIKLVSIIIDGEDPIGMASQQNGLNGNGNGNGNGTEKTDIEVVQVPINGLLDRLKSFDQNGIIIDSRVYAFAIGLKKGEKLAQAQYNPEVAETPI